MALGPVWGVAPHPNATDRETPGSFREHDIEPFGRGMVPPSWVEVPAAVAAWLGELGVASGGDRPTEALAVAHASFERIHPFLDGNGRAGRLLLNLMLVRLGYAPAIIYKRDRGRYLAALRSADAGDAGPLGELLARAVLDNLYRFIVPAVAGPNRLVPLAALATDELSEGALRTAANRGRLRGQKGDDGRWRSTRAWSTTTGPNATTAVTGELPPRGRSPSFADRGTSQPGSQHVPRTPGATRRGVPAIPGGSARQGGTDRRLGIRRSNARGQEPMSPPGLSPVLAGS